MPLERDVTNISKTGATLTTTPDAEARSNAPLSKAQRRARFVELRDRGVVNRRLTVNLPPDTYGEWIQNTPSAIDTAKAIGFEIDTKYAVNQGLHTNGATGESVVGDVIHMIMPAELKQEIDEFDRERFNAQYNRRNSKDHTAENALIRSQLQQEFAGIAPSQVETTVETNEQLVSNPN